MDKNRVNLKYIKKVIHHLKSNNGYWVKSYINEKFIDLNIFS
jgi:hypothetical protein